MKKVYSTLYSKLNVKPVNTDPNLLLQALRYISPNKSFHPTCVLLSPGIYNSAYYEHTFLAKHMGIEIVEGNDLISDDGFIYMKTTRGQYRWMSSIVALMINILIQIILEKTTSWCSGAS